MEKSNLERNLRNYAWHKIASEPLFWGPVIISYILNIGKMSLPELYFMEAVVILGMVFVEIYSSAWADLLGRRLSLMIGASLSLMSIIIFSFVDSPVEVWISNILIMVGSAIVSGSDEAFLADTLKEADREDQFTKINGSIMAKRFFIAALSGIVAGYLYSINPRLPMLLSIPGVFASIFFALSLTEPKREGRVSHREHFDLVKLSVLFVANHKALKWIVVFTTILAVTNKLWFFTYNPYFELVKLPPEFYGWVFSAISLFSWLASKYAHKVERAFSGRTLITTIVLFMVVSITVLGMYALQWTVVVIAMSGITRGFTKPFMATFTNRHLDQKNRATVLSILSSFSSLIAALCLALYGLLLKQLDLQAGLLVLAALLSIFGTYSIIRYKKVFG